MDLPLLITNDEHVPIYMQVVHQVRYLITARQLSEGDQLPSVRELASQLGVNSGTVALAYRTLQQERLIESRRGTGTFVAGQQDVNQRLAARLQKLADRADDLVRQGYALGFDGAEIRQALASQVMSRPRALPVVLALRGTRTALKYAPSIREALPANVMVDVRPADLAELHKDSPERSKLYDSAYFTITFQSSVPVLDSLLREAGIDSEIIGITANLTEVARSWLRDAPVDARVCVVTESYNVSSALNLVGRNSSLDVRSLPVLTERSTNEEFARHRGATMLYTFGMFETLEEREVPIEDRFELAFALSEDSRTRLRSLLDPHAALVAAD